MIILRPKNVNFERFWPLSKFHFPACSTLAMTHFFYFYDEGDSENVAINNKTEIVKIKQ